MKKKILVAIILIALIIVCLYKIKENRDIVEETNNTIVEETLQQSPNELITALPNLDEEGLEIEGFEETSGEFTVSATNIDIEPYKNRTILDAPVYFSQTDPRWGSIMYSSVGNPSQTIASSGCGPTSAAMVISSITSTRGDRFTIYPDEMADLYVKNGFRSANNGTYFSAFEWTADNFEVEFSRVYSTYDMADKINEGYYAIVSCSNGLFTTGGHFIVVCDREGDTLRVYDPYLYPGKFDSYGRAGKCTLSGNTVYVTISNFKAYANAKAFFLFKDNRTTPTPEPTPDPEPYYEVTKYVNTQSKNLNVRVVPGGAIIHSLSKGTRVTVTDDTNGWSYIISPVVGYVSSEYLADVTPEPTPSSYTSGNYKLKSTAYIFSNSDLTGTVYTYKPNTTITVLSNVNDTVDYIRVVATGRVGYINNKYYADTNTIYNTNTVGEYRKLKSRTYLYSNPDLTGTVYTYKANTTVKIIKNISNSVDYVYVVATGRYAYVSTNSYR